MEIPSNWAHVDWCPLQGWSDSMRRKRSRGKE